MRLNKLFNIVCLLYMLISSSIWINFVIPSHAVTALISAILLFLLFIERRIRITSRIIQQFLLLLVIFIWSTLTVSPSFGILSFCYYFPAILLMMLSGKQKKQTLSFVTKWFSIMMLISICVFVSSFLINIPSLGKFQIANNDFYSPFENYIFFIKSQDLLDQIIYRFNGPFLEPGHLSMVCSVLLFANNYDFKHNKWLWILLICIIISLSLVGYVINVAAIILLKLNNLKTALQIICLAIGGYIFVSQIWDKGDNVVNELILKRLEYDDEKGIAGNNRTTASTDSYFDRLWHHDKLWIGTGTVDKDEEIVGSGYKIYFIRFGIISAILVGIYYCLLLPKKYNKRYSYSFLIILLLLFLQRAYPWSFSWLLCFILGTAINTNRTKKFPQVQNMNNTPDGCKYHYR